MKFSIKKASDWKYNEEKEFETLKEILDWTKELEEPIIIEWEEKWKIMIYDYYIE